MLTRWFKQKHNRRRDRRVPCDGVLIQTPDNEFGVDDLSMGGCFVRRWQPAIGANIVGFLTLPQAIGERYVRIECSIVRCTDVGAAIKFINPECGMLMSLFVHLLRHDRSAPLNAVRASVSS